MPFDEDYTEEPVKRSNLKNVSSQKSMFAEKPKLSTSDFSEKVKEKIGSENLQLNETAKIASMFFDFVQKQHRKSQVVDAMDNSLLKSIVEHAKKMNDEDGISGSEFLGTILLNSTKFLRNRVSSLEEELVDLKKQIKDLKDK